MLSRPVFLPPRPPPRALPPNCSHAYGIVPLACLPTCSKLSSSTPSACRRSRTRAARQAQPATASRYNSTAAAGWPWRSNAWRRRLAEWCWCGCCSQNGLPRMCGSRCLMIYLIACGAPLSPLLPKRCATFPAAACDQRLARPCCTMPRLRAVRNNYLHGYRSR
jgi:hypothetical protein